MDARPTSVSVAERTVATRRCTLGVDPGLNLTGYAVLEAKGRAFKVIEAGVIRGGSAERAMGDRLVSIHEGLLELIDQYKPAAVSLEQVHGNVRHPRTAILMAHARGAIVLASALRKVPVFGYSATRIKKTLTGGGRASKEQMQRAVRIELGLIDLPEPHDVADACALALCHEMIARNQTLLESVAAAPKSAARLRNTQL